MSNSIVNCNAEIKMNLKLKILARQKQQRELANLTNQFVKPRESTDRISGELNDQTCVYDSLTWTSNIKSKKHKDQKNRQDLLDKSVVSSVTEQNHAVRAPEQAFHDQSGNFVPVSGTQRRTPQSSQSFQNNINGDFVPASKTEEQNRDQSNNSVAISENQGRSKPSQDGQILQNQYDGNERVNETHGCSVIRQDGQSLHERSKAIFPVFESEHQGVTQQALRDESGSFVSMSENGQDEVTYQACPTLQDQSSSFVQSSKNQQKSGSFISIYKNQQQCDSSLSMPRIQKHILSLEDLLDQSDCFVTLNQIEQHGSNDQAEDNKLDRSCGSVPVPKIEEHGVEQDNQALDQQAGETLNHPEVLVQIS